MSGTINHAALKQYAADFTSQVLADFYASKATINGQEILALTPIRQVNLGIISRIFDQWKADAQAFRSPYFDFEKEDVKNALQEFMNTVSRNIAIKQEDFHPLLLESTEDALMLLFGPADYFERKLREFPNFVFDKEGAQRIAKYTHIHAGVARNLALRLTDSGSEYVYVNQALTWLSKMLESGSLLDDRTPYIEQFSSVIPLNVQVIFPGDTRAADFTTPPKDSTGARPSGSFFDAALADTSQPMPGARPSSPVPEPAIAEFREQRNAPIPTSTGVNSLNSRFKVDIPTRSEEANYGSVPLKVDNILGSIALGQRFMFVNQLFNKNSDSFDEAIRELEQARSFEEARELMTNKFASKYFWDMNSDAVNDLMALVKRKFN
ncbi:hypothetical protein [Salmonirosea aquatica]|uniref:Uncharacterized protein n=1 Tax=Salmonirosea aquatica TaxID=2654236 RepID=A0A7C9BK02_9BACT|nr:hypothetical protein [Cytophagaceae bacterium SJW1-29]